MNAVTSLYNPEAGNHPLPTDKREIEAVERAVPRCYAAHPYLQQRYGVRGEAFCRSGGGYLATLTDKPLSYVHEQVTWLAGVLASRGMPRWLMETHLDLLSEELTSAVPERATDFLKLRRVAKSLRAERQARMAQADFDALLAYFESASGGGIKGAGGLLAAAVCDECCGLSEAVPSLSSWLSDTDRFSAQWCVAVADTLVRAHALVVPGPRRGERA